MQSTSVNQDPHAKSSVQLSLEEIKVLKECRVNSLYYRGIPLGVVTALVGRGALMTGKFPRLSRWSGIFYTGMFGLGFFSGIASYRDECIKKLLALDNSVLADQYRDFLEKRGVPSPYPKKLSEFDDISPATENIPDMSLSRRDDEYDSPLMRRMNERDEQETNKWDEIRRQSRQPYTEPTKGITYDQLRKQNRAQQNEPLQKQENNEFQKPSIDIESYQSQDFKDTYSNSVLNFTRDQDANSSSYSSDDDTHTKASSGTTTTRKSRGIVRVNKYGDAVE